MPRDISPAHTHIEGSHPSPALPDNCGRYYARVDSYCIELSRQQYTKRAFLISCIVYEMVWNGKTLISSHLLFYRTTFTETSAKSLFKVSPQPQPVLFLSWQVQSNKLLQKHWFRVNSLMLSFLGIYSVEYRIGPNECFVVNDSLPPSYISSSKTLISNCRTQIKAEWRIVVLTIILHPLLFSCLLKIHKLGKRKNCIDHLEPSEGSIFFWLMT